MNCDLCPEGEANVALVGLPGGPMFCDRCLGAILRELADRGILRSVMHVIRARREQASTKPGDER